MQKSVKGETDMNRIIALMVVVNFYMAFSLVATASSVDNNFVDAAEHGQIPMCAL